MNVTANDDVYDEEEYKITTFFSPEGNLDLYYTGVITPTFIQDIVNALNQFEYVDFKLILNSPGGDATVVKAVPMIFKKMGLTSIICTGQCSSAALAICLESLKLKIPVYMDSLTHIVLHKCFQTEVMEHRHNRITKFNETFVQVFEDLFDNINAPVLKKLSKEERNNYNNGHNVYFLAENLISWGIIKELTYESLDPQHVKRKRTPTKKTIESTGQFDSVEDNELETL